jgi:uncharacterized protein YbaR (Trm112 family)
MHPDGPPLIEHDDYLVCQVDGAAYPIRDGIPDLLPESAILPGQNAQKERP